MTELGQKPAGLECIPYCCYHGGARLRDQSQGVVHGNIVAGAAPFLQAVLVTGFVTTLAIYAGMPGPET